MATVHAATSSQEVLDRLPEAGKSDLRKNRSIMNNIILTSTGAAKALGLVIPEMKEIPLHRRVGADPDQHGLPHHFGGQSAGGAGRRTHRTG